MRLIKLLLITLTMLFLTSMSHAATVTGLSHVCSGTISTCTENSAFTALTGDDIVLGCLTLSSATHAAPSDSGTNTYTQVGSTTTYGSSRFSYWRTTNMTGFVGGHVACNTSGTTSAIVMIYTRISGLTIKTVDTDIAIASLSSASPWVSNTLVTTNAIDYIVTVVANDAVAHTYTVPTGFTASATDGTDMVMAYQAVSSTQNTTYSWTGTGATDHVIVAVTSLKDTAPTGPPPNQYPRIASLKD